MQEGKNTKILTLISFNNSFDLPSRYLNLNKSLSTDQSHVYKTVLVLRPTLRMI